MFYLHVTDGGWVMVFLIEFFLFLTYTYMLGAVCVYYNSVSPAKVVKSVN